MGFSELGLDQFNNIILCGFMGAGKSWTLKRAKKGGPEDIEFFDLDDRILEQSGYNTILKMMRDLGEDHFRNVENEILVANLKAGKKVISVGGGALNRGINFVIEKRTDILVVWLDTPLEQCEANLAKDHKNVRPLYKDNKDDIQDFYKERCDIYKVAQVRITWDEQNSIKNYQDFIRLLTSKV